METVALASSLCTTVRVVSPFSAQTAAASGLSRNVSTPSNLTVAVRLASPVELEDAP